MRNSKAAEAVKDGMDDLVKKTRGAVNDGLDSVNESFKGGVDRVDRRYLETVAQARGSVERVTSTVQDQVGDARKSLLGRYVRTRKQVSRLQRDAGKYARANPGKLLLAVAALGLLFGLFVSPRRRLAT